MSDAKKVPIVTFFMMKDWMTISEVKFGHLAVKQDGKHWIYPKAEDIDEDPDSAGAIVIDPAHLAEQPSMPDGTPLYLYRGRIES